MGDKPFYTITEIADVLGVSRVAVFKKIKAGDIKAVKIGHMYAIPNEEFASIMGRKLTARQKKIIDEAVRKTVAEYGKVLQLLGQE